MSLYIIISLKNRWKQSLIIFKAEEYRLLISSVRLHNYVGIGEIIIRITVILLKDGGTRGTEWSPPKS